MDRCHRIGQQKPVLVFRLATANSVEGRMLRRAASKMALERLVIKKGAFKEINNQVRADGGGGGAQQPSIAPTRTRPSTWRRSGLRSRLLLALATTSDTHRSCTVLLLYMANVHEQCQPMASVTAPQPQLTQPGRTSLHVHRLSPLHPPPPLPGLHAHPPTHGTAHACRTLLRGARSL